MKTFEMFLFLIGTIFIFFESMKSGNTNHYFNQNNISKFHKLQIPNNYILHFKDNRYYVSNVLYDGISGSFQHKFSKAVPLCCKFSEGSCSKLILVRRYPCPTRHDHVTYGDAIVKCDKLGLRLCSKDEFLSNECYKELRKCEGARFWSSNTGKGIL